jgi:hypothetical protein
MSVKKIENEPPKKGSEWMAEALKLAEEFGDGDAGVAFKREKTMWYALLFFDLSSKRLGFIERGWGGTPEDALTLLIDRVKIQAQKKREREALAKKDGDFKAQSTVRAKVFDQVVEIGTAKK